MGRNKKAGISAAGIGDGGGQRRGGGGNASHKHQTQQPGAKIVVSEVAKETQQCELISLDAMFPGAVKVLHPGFLTAEDIVANNLTEAPEILEAGSAAWHIPEQADIDDERETLISLPAIGSSGTDPNLMYPNAVNDKYLQYRILFLQDESDSIAALVQSGARLTVDTPRFVLGVTCPPKYPPRPPCVRLYTTIRMTPQQRKTLQTVALATLLDNHPLFPERIIPLCEIITAHINTSCATNGPTRGGDFVMSTEAGPEMSQDTVEPGSQATTDRQTVLDTESILAAKSRRLHADVLRGLGHEEYTTDGEEVKSPSHTVLSSTSSKTTPLSTLMGGEGLGGDTSPFVYPSNRNPLDFYILAHDRQGCVTEEDGGARSLGKHGRRRRRPLATRRKVTAGTATVVPVGAPQAITTFSSSENGTKPGQESPAASYFEPPKFVPKVTSQTQRETRLLTDYDSFVPITSIADTPSSCWHVGIQARNKVDKCLYEIRIYRTEALSKRLLGTQNAAQRDQLVARLISDIQSYSHMDQPHLQRVQSVWSEPLKTGFIASLFSHRLNPISGGGVPTSIGEVSADPTQGKTLTRNSAAPELVSAMSAIDFSSVTANGETLLHQQPLIDLLNQTLNAAASTHAVDSEMCVIVQAEYVEHLVGLRSGGDTRRLLTKDNLMPARIAQQMLEALAFLHNRSFVYLGDLRTAGLEIDDWGVKVKLRVPEFFAPFFLTSNISPTLPPTGVTTIGGLAAILPPGVPLTALAAAGSLLNLTDLHRSETAGPLYGQLPDSGLEASQILGLSPELSRYIRQHQVLCPARCRSLSSSCSLLQKVDLCLFCQFFMELMQIADAGLHGAFHWAEDKTSFSKTYRKFESLARSPLQEMMSALELLQDQAVFKPLVSREALKNLLMQLGNPSSNESLAVVSRLFEQPANLSSGSFLFHSQEASLSRHWEDFLPALMEQWAAAVDELAATAGPSSEEANSSGIGIEDDGAARVELIQQFADAESALHFLSYTDTLSLSTVLYKDLYTLQLFESMLDRLCCVELDLPTVVPLQPLASVELPTLLQFRRIRTIRERWLSVLQQYAFVGALPSEPPTMYLNQGNFLITCPRSLIHCVTSLFRGSSDFHAEQASSSRLLASREFVSLQPVQRPSGQCGYPLSSLRALYCAWHHFGDFPDSSDGSLADAGGGYSARQLLPFWLHLLTAVSTLLSPFHRVLKQYRIVVSFPMLLDQLLQRVTTSSGTSSNGSLTIQPGLSPRDLAALRRAVALGSSDNLATSETMGTRNKSQCASGAGSGSGSGSYGKSVSGTLADTVRLAVLKGFSEYGTLNARETLEALDTVSESMPSSGARAIISDIASAVVEMHSFLSQPGALGPTGCTVLFDLFAPPAWISAFYPASAPSGGIPESGHAGSSGAAGSGASIHNGRFGSSNPQPSVQTAVSFSVYRSMAIPASSTGEGDLPATLPGAMGSVRRSANSIDSSLDQGHSGLTPLQLDALVAVGGMVFDSQHGPISLAEVSIELLSRLANHTESETYALEGGGLAYLSHARTPQVLVVMQTWSTCEAAVALAGKLQLLGIQADWRARPVVNLQHIRREVPANCSALLHVVFLKNVGGSKGIVYKVESLGSHHSRSDIRCGDGLVSGDQIWTSHVFDSESATVSFILGQVARTKSQVRSAVLRDCAKRTKILTTV